ncbi:MAG: hypothetical protein JXO44_10310 [Clostridia bacterium]|nr:hypothetical protein [Clostridia bacterium]
MKKKLIVIFSIIIIGIICVIGVGIKHNQKITAIELSNFKNDIDMVLSNYEFDYELEVYKNNENTLLTAQLLNTNFQDLGRETQYNIVKAFTEFIDTAKYEKADNSLFVESEGTFNKFNIANENLERNGYTHFFGNFAEGGDKNIANSNRNQTATMNKPLTEDVEDTKEVQEVEKVESQLEQFMSKNNISLTAKDVEFDLSNHLNMSFALEGTGELSSYYNYGFRDLENDCFCVNISNDDSSEDWYIYFYRDSFKRLFDDLKENGSADIIVKCQIYSYQYEQNMNNMAMAESVSWH